MLSRDDELKRREKLVSNQLKQLETDRKETSELKTELLSLKRLLEQKQAQISQKE